MDKVNERVHRTSRPYLLGININKNPDSTGERAAQEAITLYQTLSPKADYFTINLSSPVNETFIHMLDRLSRYKNALSEGRPVLLKLPADLSTEAMEKVVGWVRRFKLDGVIAAGPTMDRSGISNYTAKELAAFGPGGVSGKGMGSKSREIVKQIRERLGKDFLIIGAGGVMTPKDTQEMLAAGADLIQIYSAFIFSGPSIVKQMSKEM